MAATWQTTRRYVLTGSVAAVVMTGTWYGAGLKTQQEYKQERQEIHEAPVEARIAQLEGHRARMITKRTMLEKKLADLRGKRKNREGDKGDGNDALGDA
ncbi:MAG: hypothetical protein M4579_001555 [Chaenotheca gracillima]|nr:MAG: hypothetical protein M4579_001555 [Chaenotheca gracillima]